MSPELDKKLCEKYPKIFCHRYGDPKNTAMCWGFDCGDGWYHIIDKLCAIIQHEIDWSVTTHEYDVVWNQMIDDVMSGDLSSFNKRYGGYSSDYQKETLEKIQNGSIKKKEVRDIIEQVVAEQVKEKFGTLRFYTNHMTEKMFGAISMAEFMSSITCETCGKPGKLITNGWRYVACEEHTRVEDREEIES